MVKIYYILIGYEFGESGSDIYMVTENVQDAVNLLNEIKRHQEIHDYNKMIYTHDWYSIDCIIEYFDEDGFQLIKNKSVLQMEQHKDEFLIRYENKRQKNCTLKKGNTIYYEEE